MILTKQCSKCGEVKPLTDFYKSNTLVGRRGECKKCKYAYDKNYTQSQKENSTMSELISSKQVAEEFKIAPALATSYLEAAKVPAHKLLVGTESMSVYDKVAAFKAVDARVKEEKAAAEANIARLEAAKIPTLKDVMSALKALAADVSDVAELNDEIKRLTAANQGMFKALTEFKTDTADRLAGIRTLVVNMRDEAKAVPHVIVAREMSRELEKVAVVGISTMHHASLSAEFGDLVNLKLLDSSDIRGIHNLRGHGKVFLMKKTTDYKHSEQLKAVKVVAESVTGSLEELRDKLTAYCLSVV